MKRIPLGRPPRKDNPRKVTFLISEKAFAKLEKISAFKPSRGFVVEQLILKAPEVLA
jgi:hypothetical protein